MSEDEEKIPLGEKISYRKSWLLWIILGGICAILAIKILYPNVYCREFGNVYALAFPILITGLIAARAIFAKDEVAKNYQILYFPGILILVTAFVLFTAPTLGQTKLVGDVFCPFNCSQAQTLYAQSLNASGNEKDGLIEQAERAARECLANAKYPNQTYSAEGILTNILSEKMDISIDQKRCTTAKTTNVELFQLADSGRGGESSRSAIVQMNKRYCDSCGGEECTPPPAPTPTPARTLNLVNIHETDQLVKIDFQVLPSGNFSKDNFQISNGEFIVPAIQFEERKADDPVCLIAVVDNSGSICSGKNDVRDALDFLNEVRKPDDELGLVVFGGKSEISVQDPLKKDISSNLVTCASSTTALWNGIERGLAEANKCRADSRYMIVITDGKNTVPYNNKDSETLAREFAMQAEEKGVAICPLSIPSQYLQERPLQLLATDCPYRSVKNTEDYRARFQEIVGYRRDFYRLTFSRKDLVNNLALNLVVDGVSIYSQPLNIK